MIMMMMMLMIIMMLMMKRVKLLTILEVPCKNICRLGFYHFFKSWLNERDDDQNNETLYQVPLPMNTAVYAPRKRIYAGIAIYAYACC